MDARRAAESDHRDAIATVSIEGGAIGRDIVLMYDPKADKWSLYNKNGVKNQ